MTVRFGNHILEESASAGVRVGGGVLDLSDADRRLMAGLGVSEEQFAKWNPPPTTDRQPARLDLSDAEKRLLVKMGVSEEQVARHGGRLAPRSPSSTGRQFLDSELEEFAARFGISPAHLKEHLRRG